MDNETLRKDEIEALSAIYGDDLMLEEEESHGFSVTLNHPDENDKTIKLDIRFSLDYPLNGPPYYTLSAPWMSRNLKSRLTAELNTIYLDNQGESILFMWIEKAREYLDKDETSETITGSTSETTGGHSITPDNENSDEQITPSLHGNKYLHSSDKFNDDVGEGGDAGGCGGVEDDESYDYKYEEYYYHHYHHKDHNGLASDIQFVHGEPIVDRRSVFQAHICPVDCTVQVQSAMTQLKLNKKIANATHNIMAYRIISGGGTNGGSSHRTFIQDCDDDGETAAGGRLLHLLQLLDVKNVLVVVSRWYGGVNLGADRFKHINNVARDLLVKCGYIEVAAQEKSNSGPNSNRKKKSK